MGTFIAMSARLSWPVREFWGPSRHDLAKWEASDSDSYQLLPL